MLPNKILYLDEGATNKRYIRSSARSSPSIQNHLDIVQENTSIGRIRLMIGSEENVIVENSQLYSKRVITAVAGVKGNTYNSNGNNDVNIQRDGTTLITLNATNQIEFGGELKLPLTNQYITFNNCKIREGFAGLSYFDFINEDATGHFRFYLGAIDSANLKTAIQPTLINLFNETIINQKLKIIDGYGLESNLINSNGNNNVVFQRNDVEFFKLDKFTEDTVEKEAIICSKQLRANGNILIKNLQINQFPVGVEYADFRLENVDSIMRFYVGNSTSVNFQITNTGLTLGRLASFTAGLKTNIIDTYTDTDLIFRRNGVEYFRLDDLTGTDILNVANDKGVSASYVFGNRFWNRSFLSDTTFFGSNVAGDDRVEYMKWNYSSQSVDYNAPIDNTGLAITGNIIDTTVSDERLKTNIQDVDTDFTSCIKNVKVKTFKYKDDKYKTNDTYGFIAQELKEHLPKECKNIVKENKVKNEDETFLSINYMKLSVVLWKCCQEQQSKIEHLEASMYEMMEDIKELKGKKTTKPKAKAKSKEKA